MKPSVLYDNLECVRAHEYVVSSSTEPKIDRTNGIKVANHPTDF